jgi:glycosyltransferase involved in cell wall biosynthesis
VKGVSFDFIASDELESPELQSSPLARVLNLRGSQDRSATVFQKGSRVLRYYVRLISYAFRSKAGIFHLLWNNKFELLDRTFLMLLYRLLGKKVVLTIHNVNVGKRDGNDSWLNRSSLRCQYALANHSFVHTQKMKEELTSEFGIPEARVSVIPFGINNTLPNTSLTSEEARARLGVSGSDQTILFFGNIAPYKGLEYLVAAFAEGVKTNPRYRLIIAGTVKNCQEYWGQIERALAKIELRERVLAHIRYIPDEDAEIYLKAADVLVLPYTEIFQSGVLFLGYSFGLPVLAADVGSLRESIVEGKTGFVFKAGDVKSLESALSTFFSSNLYAGLANARSRVQAFANESYSWDTVGTITSNVYDRLLGSFNAQKGGIATGNETLSQQHRRHPEL